LGQKLLRGFLESFRSLELFLAVLLSFRIRRSFALRVGNLQSGWRVLLLVLVLFPHKLRKTLSVLDSINKLLHGLFLGIVGLIRVDLRVGVRKQLEPTHHPYQGFLRLLSQGLVREEGGGGLVVLLIFKILFKHRFYIEMSLFGWRFAVGSHIRPLAVKFSTQSWLFHVLPQEFSLFNNFRADVEAGISRKLSKRDSLGLKLARLAERCFDRGI